MQTAYDLLLQPVSREAPFDPAPVQAALKTRGAIDRPDGALVWRFPVGEVVALVLREAGAVVGVELRVPFSDRTELLTQVLAASVDVAKELSLQLIDPQLGRTVVELDGASVSESFLRISRYAGQYYGLGDAFPMPLTSSVSDDDRLSPMLKGVLAVLVFAVALGAALQFFSPD